jgi:hypothetical protein
MIRDFNPMPEIPAGGLGMPPYTNPAQAQASAMCRRDGGTLFRVTAIYDETGNRFGYDLCPYDAESEAKWLSRNRGYSDVTLCKIR